MVFLAKDAESVHSKPKGIIPSRYVNFIPFLSRACRMASKLFGIGNRRPFSKSRTVDNETRAASAKSCCDISSQPRAARLCSGDMKHV